MLTEAEEEERVRRNGLRENWLEGGIGNTPAVEHETKAVLRMPDGAS